MSNEYWEQRIKAEIEAKLQLNHAVAQEVERLYDYQFKEIEKDINSWLQRYSDGQNININEARKRVSEFDVRAFEAKAKQYVAEKDFSAKANAELKLYNLKMRMNSAELLQRELQLQMLALAEGERQLTEKFLTQEYMDTLRTQAGLLNQYVPSQRDIMNQARATINTPFQGAVWSDKIWERQSALREILQKDIQSMIFRGENPTKIVGKLRKEFNASKSSARRLAITEMARVQTEVQKQTLLDNDYEEYKFVSEGRACSICLALDGQIFKVSEMTPGVNAAPMHPYCRCACAGYFDWRKSEKKDTIKVEAEEEEFIPAKTIKEANEFAKQMGFNADYKGIHINNANEWNKGLFEAKKQFPEVTDRIRFVGSAQARNAQIKKIWMDWRVDYLGGEEWAVKQAKREANRLAGKVGQYVAAQSSKYEGYDKMNIPEEVKAKLRETTGITMNKSLYNEYDKMINRSKASVKRQWNPEGCWGTKAIFDHEFGHQLDDYLGLRKNKVIQNEYDSRTREQIKEDLSEYAWNNNNPDRYSEMIAEAWSEYRNNPEPRQMAKTIGEEIEKAWKKRKGN